MFGIDLSGILPRERVVMAEKLTKSEALDILIDLLAVSPVVTSPQELEEGIRHREKLMSTGIGFGLAIPHVRMRSIRDLAVAAMVVREGIADYESMDAEPVRIVFMIVAREDQHAQHLKLLSALTGALKHSENRDKLLGCRDTDELYRVLAGKG